MNRVLHLVVLALLSATLSLAATSTIFGFYFGVLNGDTVGIDFINLSWVSIIAGYIIIIVVAMLNSNNGAAGSIS